MSSRIPRSLTVAAAALALVAAGAIAAPSPASAHWSCGRAAPPDIDTTGGHHTEVVVNLRVGSSLRCLDVGDVSPSESLDYHCYALDINGLDTWTYVVSVQTKAGGWIRDDGLNDNGSRKWCPNQTQV
ncbi:hypothetical protein JOD64_001813 [Micromonospora luteifusca]|uniref:SH3 domain-containing protein n=1 Tax=Micromonospora luteifusca TaxID=709860 RepID=A0ABS2LQW8_9ACTN|nr:hypothetical protein [Micromonospora luteifusca]MBM7490591.1 hypothetical protein [Micromonospora luteifusca]